jgi:GT2 family glycosyltransferase
VLIVNSDAGLAADCLGVLEGALRERADVGIAGPVIRWRQDAGKSTSLGPALRAAIRPHARSRGRSSGAILRASEIERVDAMRGCVMLVRRVLRRDRSAR